jgi:hypothetical protein
MNYVKKYSATFVFFTIIVLLSPSIFFGIDVQDAGFHLSQQILANYLGPHYISHLNGSVKTYWFSNVVGGWWLLLLKKTHLYNLVGVRLGTVICYALSGALVAKSFDRNNSHHSYILLFSVVVGSICSADITFNVLGYMSIPIFLFSLWACCLAQGIFGKPKYRIVFAVLAGLLSLLIVMARLPSLPILLVPIIILIITFFYAHHDSDNIKKTIIIIYLAMIAAAICMYIELKLTGQWQHMLLLPRSDKMHNISYLIKSYTASFLAYFLIIYFIFSMSFGIAFFEKTVFAKEKISIKCCAYLFIAQMFFINSLKIPIIAKLLAPHSTISWMLYIFPANTINYFNMIACYFIAFTLLFMQFRKKNMFFEMVLFLFAIFMPIAVALGANEGFYMLVLGIWYILPLTTYMILDTKISNKSFYWLWGLFLAFIFILTLLNLYFHRDRDKNIFLLKTPLQSVNLRYIYTTSLKQKTIDEFISVINKHVTSGSHILIYPNFPMGYFATNTIPLCASAIPLMTKQVLADLHNTLCVSKFPKVIVRVLFQPYNNDWSNKDIYLKSASSSLKAYDNIVKQNCNPKIIWQNDFFKVMVPQQTK